MTRRGCCGRGWLLVEELCLWYWECAAEPAHRLLPVPGQHRHPFAGGA
jgi:hypothetical protein